MPRPAGVFSRALEPLGHVLWPVFIAWTLWTAAVWWLGADWIATISNAGLRSAVQLIVRWVDAIWFLLGGLNLYLDIAAREGIKRARSLGLLIFFIAATTGWLTVRTGLPFGTMVFTDLLGLRLATVPIGWLLLWFVVLNGSRVFVNRLLPRLSHNTGALLSGIVSLATMLNLEPLAGTLRLFWFRYLPGTTTPSPAPMYFFAAVFLLAAAVAWLDRERQVARGRTSSTRFACIIVLVNAVFALGHLRLLFPS